MSPISPASKVPGKMSAPPARRFCFIQKTRMPLARQASTSFFTFFTAPVSRACFHAPMKARLPSSCRLSFCASTTRKAVFSALT